MNLENVFNQLTELETPRLILRAIRPTDRDALYQLFGNAEVTRYNDIEQFQRISDADQMIVWIQNQYAQRKLVRWAITQRGGMDRLIGTCGFNVLNRYAHYGEIGYDLHPAYWGQGIMTEAVAALIRFGFQDIGLNRIEANVSVGNIASVQVLSKLGFRYEGLLRQRGYWKGKYHDLEWYALLREEMGF